MKKKRGFTLIEIMVALLVFAIISASIAMGLHQVFKNKTVTDSQQKRLAALQMTLLMMRRDIAQAIYHPMSHTTRVLSDFFGLPNQVFFTRTGFVNPLSKERRSELQHVEYQVEKGILVRKSAPVLGQETSMKRYERVLYRDIQAIPGCAVFSYFDKNNQLYDHWPPVNKERTGLPSAVQVAFYVPDWGNVTQYFLIEGSAPE